MRKMILLPLHEEEEGSNREKELDHEERRADRMALIPATAARARKRES